MRSVTTIESDSGTPTFESTVTAAATTSSESVPLATGHSSMTSPLQYAPPALSSATSSSTLSTSSSIAVSTAVTAAVTPTVVPFPGITHSVKFKAGVSAGAAALLLLLLALFCWRKRRRTHQHEPAKSRYEDPSNTELVNTVHYGLTKPPDPNPYAQRFPSSQLPNDGRGPVDSRSRSNFSLVPDNDREPHRRQPNLQHAPALNPYNFSPPAAAAEAALGDQRHWQDRSPAPSYMTEDPALRVQTSRSRQHLGQRERGIQEVLGDERFGG